MSLKEKKVMSSYFWIDDDLNSAVSTYTLLQQPHPALIGSYVEEA